MKKNILIKNVDIELLKLQNKAILRCIDDTKEPEEKELLNGIWDMVETMIEQKTDVEYSEEDLKTDLVWFSNLGLDEEKAQCYIMYLLNSVEEEKK